MQLLFQMAHLPSAEIAARREAAKQDILSVWNNMQGCEVYVLQCPCRIDCGCMDEDEFPRIVLRGSTAYIIFLALTLKLIAGFWSLVYG